MYAGQGRASVHDGRLPPTVWVLAPLQVGTWPSTGQEMDGEWDESWNKIEPFSVTVVPSDPQPGTEPGRSDTDLFQDMQPVIKKARKVGQSAGTLLSNQDPVMCMCTCTCRCMWLLSSPVVLRVWLTGTSLQWTQSSHQ